MDDCILSSLFLPPVTKSIINAASCSSALDASALRDNDGRPEASVDKNSLERESRRISEPIRHRLRETRDSGGWQLQVRGGSGSISQEKKAQNSVNTRPQDETIDLTTSKETTVVDSAANENSQSLRGGRVLRKRKLSGGLDIPPKRPVEAAALL